jgi:dTDP-4-amino-4,6-dideoxygalactose transaminase
MLEMQAVIGRIQLLRMPEWAAARKRNALAIWNECAQFLALRVPALKCHSCSGVCASSGCEHAYYKCYVYVRPEQLAHSWTRDRIIEAINAEGVSCFQGSCSEVYLEKAFDGTGWRPGARLLVARELGESSIMFLVHPTLTQAEIDKTCKVIREVMLQASA